MMALMKYRPPCAPAMIVARALEMLRMAHIDVVHADSNDPLKSSDTVATSANANAGSSESESLMNGRGATVAGRGASEGSTDKAAAVPSNLQVPSWLMNNVASAASQV
jgi:hypothetical protein